MGFEPPPKEISPANFLFFLLPFSTAPQFTPYETQFSNSLLKPSFQSKLRSQVFVVGEELIESIAFLQASHLLVLMAKDFQNRKR
jgi:hypothetical protein